MAVPAYVINLPASVDETLHRRRRAHIESELRRASVAYRFVESVDGFRLTAEERAALVDEQHVARNPWLTAGILGASLSHLAAYRAILDDGPPVALILEDDAVLPHDLAQLLEALADRISQSEVVLLYWRSVEGPAVFSTSDALRLPSGAALRYPCTLEQLGCASAYLVTADACRRLIEAVTPIRSCTDTWATFHEWGAFDSLRCVVPRPVGSRTDFKSTVNYHGGDSLRSRMSSFVAHRRLFPFHTIFGVVRAARERRMSRYVLTSQRSPLAQQRATPR
jgi:glycosyl transferase family 25